MDAIRQQVRPSISGSVNSVIKTLYSTPEVDYIIATFPFNCEEKEPLYLTAMTI